jgi:tricorn protease
MKPYLQLRGDSASSIRPNSFSAGVLIRIASVLLLCLALPSPRAIDIRNTRMLSQPAVSHDHIAFVYAGDIWVCQRDGSNVRRLTTHPGDETNPRFSPDGRSLAFSGQYDGNLDVYLVPVSGGVPQRLTWHPGPDLAQDFRPDGKAVLFTSPRSVHTTRYTQLFTISIDGGHPDPVPIPHASMAAYSPDGSRIAYAPVYEAFRQWKNYRGGTISRIWLYQIESHEVGEIPKPKGGCNDTAPMWIGGTLYFLSDRHGEFNLYSYHSSAKAVDQLTFHADFPVVHASAGGGVIVYEQAGYLHLYDPASKSARQLAIGVAADLIETRPRFVSGAQYIRDAHISPSGARAVFEYRGEIVTVPAEKGDPRNLTQSTASHERGPAWSPDGKSIAYFSDASGEYALHIAPQDGKGDVRKLPLHGAGFYEDLRWSPDGQRVSYVDNSWSLFVLDLKVDKTTKIDSEPVYGPASLRSLQHAWSPDSRWLAYTIKTESGHQRVHLYSLEQQRSHAVTEGLSDVSEPVFDAQGKYLLFFASTDAGPVVNWFAMSNADMEITRSLYLAVLQKGTNSPFLKESDEEKPKEEARKEKGDTAKEEEKDAAAKPDKEPAKPPVETAPLKIDLDGLAQRIVALPLPSAFYRNLQAGDTNQIYYLKSDRAPGGSGGSGLSLVRYDLEKRKEETLAEKVNDYSVSANQKKILLNTGENWLIAAAGEKIDLSKGKLATGSIQVKIDPRAEWPQIFHEAWRINRDYFYDPNMHGADWPALREKYAAFLPHLAARPDLNRVIQWMCSELAVGHSYLGGGDRLSLVNSIPGGLLGADFEVAEGRYRFKKVFGGLNWNPELRAPLTEPGVDVRAGEYLLAVNGADLRPPENLHSRFENTSGKLIEITVGSDAAGAQKRTVQVVPIGNEAALRNRDWVESNMRKVHEATSGRVAYVYVPNTATLGHLYFKRYFFPQADKEAIIVDERHNGGGQVADYYIDILRRPYISHWTTRYGKDFRTPQGAIFGPKVMLINETAGSGGDLLPWMFRKLNLGPLIGKRTWGGLVGILGFPTLMDGGGITAPNLAFWAEDGFRVENEGVPPDIEIEMWPKDVIAGRDPQLEKAIEVILRSLKENPLPAVKRPPFPVRVRR